MGTLERDTERSGEVSVLRGSLLYFRNAEVFADFTSEVVIDLCMSGNGGALILLCVVPPRMAGAFAQDLAAVSLQVADQLLPFHTAMCASS